MSIDDRLLGFIESTSSTAIVLRGGWGEGKTHFWKKFALDHLAKGKERRPNYAYVSLFGLNSLAELRNALSTTIRPVDRIADNTFLALLGDESDPRSKVEKGASWFRRKVNALANAANGAGVSVPHIGNLGPLYLAFAYTFVKSAVICIDDIERRGKGLELKDVLGLIADLTNERNCAIAVILNDETFDGGDKEIWAAHREKVFMGEVLFQSDPMRAAGFVYDLNHLSTFERIAIDAIVQLGIKNVRIIQRIKAVNDQVLQHLVGIDLIEATFTSVIRGIVMIVYCHVGQASGAPPLALLKGNQRVRDMSEIANGDGKAPEKSEQQLRWEGVLRTYNYFIGNRLDELLNQSVVDGYPDIEQLKRAARTLDNELRSAAKLQAARDAWRLFHDKAGDNAEEFITTLGGTVLATVPDIGVNNVDDAVYMARQLGYVDLADEIMNAWINDRRELRWREMAPESVVELKAIQDKAFEVALDKAYQERVGATRPDFDTVMGWVLRANTHSKDTVEGLAAADVADYIAYFNANGVGSAKLLLGYPPSQHENYRIINTKVRAALDSIEKQSLIDKLRVKEVLRKNGFQATMQTRDEYGNPVVTRLK